MKKWLKLLKQFAPIILKVAGVPPRFIEPATKLINEAEQIPGASGADKKAHVLAGIQEVLTAARVKEAPKIMEIAKAGIDTVVSVVNTVHRAAPVEP